jgi:hypothetical protein
MILYKSPRHDKIYSLICYYSKESVAKMSLVIPNADIIFLLMLS